MASAKPKSVLSRSIALFFVLRANFRPPRALERVVVWPSLVSSFWFFGLLVEDKKWRIV